MSTIYVFFYTYSFNYFKPFIHNFFLTDLLQYVLIGFYSL